MAKRDVGSRIHTPKGKQAFKGMPGIQHGFENVGVRGRDLLMVVGGAVKKNDKRPITCAPEERMEGWRSNKVLFSAYDVKG